MTNKVSYNQWYAGMSNDIWQRRKGEYYYSEGIDVRNDGKAFQLYGFDKDILSLPLGNTLTSVLGNPKSWPDLFGFKNGYLKDSSGTSYNTAISEDITDIGIYGDYAYLVHWTGVSRWQIDLTASDLGLGTDGSNITTDYFTFSGENCQKILALDETGDYAYLYGGKDIYRFASDYTSQQLSIVRSNGSGQSVKKITRIGSNYHIFFADKKIIIPGRIASVTDTVKTQKRVNYDGYTILDAINSGNANYVIAEDKMQNRTSILIDSGYKNQELYSTRWGEQNPYDNARIVFDNIDDNIAKLSKKGSMVYISGWQTGRVYSLWKQYSELSQALTVDYKDASDITCLWAIEDGIVVGTTNEINIIRLVDPEDTQQYSGYLETTPFVGKEQSTNKRLKNVWIWYEMDDTSWISGEQATIKIYRKYDKENYELINTIDSNEDANGYRKLYTVNGSFNKLQLKVELDKDDVQSPKVFDIGFTYDIVDNGKK